MWFLELPCLCLMISLSLDRRCPPETYDVILQAQLSDMGFPSRVKPKIQYEVVWLLDKRRKQQNGTELGLDGGARKEYCTLDHCTACHSCHQNCDWSWEFGKIGMNSSGIGVYLNADRCFGHDTARLLHLALRVSLEAKNCHSPWAN